MNAKQTEIMKNIEALKIEAMENLHDVEIWNSIDRQINVLVDEYTNEVDGSKIEEAKGENYAANYTAHYMGD